MTRDDVINRLKAHDVELRQLGVERLYLFRSTARDGATDSSDVDLFSTTSGANSACSS